MTSVWNGESVIGLINIRICCITSVEHFVVKPIQNGLIDVVTWPIILLNTGCFSTLDIDNSEKEM